MAIGNTSTSNSKTTTSGGTSTEKKEKTTTASSGGYSTTSATNKGYSGRSSPSTTDPGQPNNPGYTGRNSNPNYGGAPTSSPYSTNGSGSKRGGGTKHTTTSTVKDEPVMTVDEVYGKEKKTVSGYNTASNTTSSVTSSYLPSVEKQGDYAASSNEKSVVKTDTFGKQDEISVTPELITENKGEVGNDTIQSVEGLDFQQKDKESQAVLDSKKSRDEVEAEEKADNMRDKLRNLNKETETTETAMQVGESDAEKSYKEQDASYVQKLNEQKAALNDTEESLRLTKEQLDIDARNVEKNKAKTQQDLDFVNNAIDAIENGTTDFDSEEYSLIVSSDNEEYNRIVSRYNNGIKRETTVETLEEIKTKLESRMESYENGTTPMQKELAADQKRYEYDLKLYDLDRRDFEESVQSYTTWKQGADEKVKNGEVPDVWEPKSSVDEYNRIQAEQEKEYTKDSVEIMKEYNVRDYNNIIEQLKAYDASSEEYQEAKRELSNLIRQSMNTNNSLIPQRLWREYQYSQKPEDVIETAEKIRDYITNEFDTKEDEWINNIREDLLGSNASEEVKTEVSESLDKVENSRNELLGVVSEMPDSQSIYNLTDEQINTYVEANQKYLDNLKEAQNKGLKLANTDFNDEYAKDISLANDFDIKFADGSTMSYSDFVLNMALQSPRLAESMYNAKAERYEKEGKKLLADLERLKAKMCKNDFGIHLVGADNKVRNQFIQMCETNERATYAAYNNVLNDPNAKPADRVDAEIQMTQAKLLSRAADTLKASTGLGGIGNSVNDTVYGQTDPNYLSTYQRVLNTTQDVVKIILGAGVTPGAVDAWNNFYNTASDKIKSSDMFNFIYSFDPDKDGFNVFQEVDSNATVGLVSGTVGLGTGTAMLFNPSTAAMGVNLIKDSVLIFIDNLYGIQGDVQKSMEYTEQVLDYFKEARDMAQDAGNQEVTDIIDDAINKITTKNVSYDTTTGETTVTENFELGPDEVNDFDNWLEGSGSNTADNEKFNQSLTYEEWLKLIEADPTMREYAKNLLKDKPAAEEKAEEKAEEDKTDAEKTDAE